MNYILINLCRNLIDYIINVIISINIFVFEITVMIEDEENLLDEPISPEPKKYKNIPLIYSWGKN